MGKEKEIEEFYDEYLDWKKYLYEDYRHANIDSFILSAISPSERVLDMGCGPGELLAKLRNRELYGCDISRKALAKVPKRVKARYVNLEEGNLPYESGFFDCIVLREVIEHIVDRKKLLGEVNRILKKGGKLIITTPNKYSTVYLPYLVLSKVAMQPVEQWFSKGELHSLLEGSGFTVERFESMHFVPWHSYLPKVMLPVIKRIDGLFRNNRLNRNIFFLARKD